MGDDHQTPIMGDEWVMTHSHMNTHTKQDCYLFSLGSMVQKGKFSAGAEAFVSTLKNVDFLQKQTLTINICANYLYLL